jgi:hypothetical protein
MRLPETPLIRHDGQVTFSGGIRGNSRAQIPKMINLKIQIVAGATMETAEFSIFFVLHCLIFLFHLQPDPRHHPWQSQNDASAG